MGMLQRVPLVRDYFGAVQAKPVTSMFGKGAMTFES